MTATRRLAAILAADVVGYSRLIGADEEATLTRLRSIRTNIIDPQVLEDRGRIVKTTGVAREGYAAGLKFNLARYAERWRSRTKTPRRAAARPSPSTAR
jgi:class 3 adenylate cyclase